jgi:putative endonuclease
VNPKDDLGRSGEQVAAEYLERAGLRVLDRNWRSATGEIDIVAVERRVLVVCEVKTRSGTGFGTPL